MNCLLNIKPKPLLGLKTSCIALMNIQTLVPIEILIRAAETEQLRKLFPLKTSLESLCLMQFIAQ